MAKTFDKEFVRKLRNDFNEAVKDAAAKNGVEVSFGNAHFQDLNATFTVNVTFAQTADRNPAKELWDANCHLLHLDKEDFGRSFLIPGENTTYRISGYNPKARKNRVIIQRLSDGGEFVANPDSIRLWLGKDAAQKVVPPAAAGASTVNPQKMEWDLNCWRWGFKPEDFGKRVTISSTEYIISGCKPNARKNCILIDHCKTGKTYVAPADAISEALLTSGLLKEGSIIKIHAWGELSESTMECTEVKTIDGQTRYLFSNGVFWTDADIKANIRLWNMRNGYEIIHKE